MAKIIFDFGSGNTCKNKKYYVKNMYDELKKIDTGKHNIFIKWQLFKEAGNNVPLRWDIFDYAYNYGNELGYKVTASIVDIETLEQLLQYKVPFIKIKNDRNLDYLLDFIPEDIPVYISHSRDINFPENVTKLLCVSKYPSTVEDYEGSLPLTVGCNISDHTETFQLFEKYKPEIIEWHYKLRYSTGLDAGSFAHTPEQLKEKNIL